MIASVENRRSIRRYKSAAVPKNLIEEVLKAGALAPSSKNRQPWKFVVVSGEAKEKMLAAMQEGLKREKETALLPESSGHLGGAEQTLRIMREAPVVICIVNTLGISLFQSLSAEERVYEICNVQSIGAAIENMTLTATELGLGSLWICDTFFAYEELQNWLNTGGELAAALALGYADEQPGARPRKPLPGIVEWRI